MTKKELSEYRSIVQEIEELEISLAKSKQHTKVTGSDTEFPYNKRGISITGFKNSDKTGNDLSHLNSLKSQCDKVNRFIENIPDRITKKIFLFKYIYGDVKVSWSEVAESVGGGNTAEGVKKIAYRYLAKISKK